MNDDNSKRESKSFKVEALEIFNLKFFETLFEIKILFELFYIHNSPS